MTTLRTAIADAARRIGSASDTPLLDAELLMAHALGIEREAMLLDPARWAVPDAYAALVERRCAHEPIAYIVGYRDFWTVRIGVGPGVLIPRADSETLIEAAVGAFGTGGPRTILDLGTGPGTLLLAALAQWPSATGIGIDASAAALAYARANAEALGLAPRARFALGDWAGHTPADLVLCNPPYVEAYAALDPQVARFEPHEALFAGDDGLDAYRRIAPCLADSLFPGGVAILEIGAGQRHAVSELLGFEGFDAVAHQDLGGHDRALLCRLR